MGKKGTLEGYKQELVGKKFARLTVLDIQPYYTSTGKTNGFSAVCRCDCGNIKNVTVHCLLKGTTTSCGCLQKEKARNNIKQALKWNEEHPEEMKQIRDKGIRSMLEWQKSHPEEASRQKQEAVNKALQWREEHQEEVKMFLEKAHQWQKDHPEEFAESLSNNIKKAQNESVLIRFSKEEKEVYDYLLSLGYSVERQFLLDNHYYDFKINNFLIEYNGSVYHCSDYCNQENTEAKLSMQNFKSESYNRSLREIAINNGYHLIQVWDYQWLHDKDFLKKLTC